MNQNEQFEKEVKENISRMGADQQLQNLSLKWLLDISPYKYSYNFKCLGRPIIQLPQDIIAMQEIIWQVRPDLIIETGIAHGGSLVLNASMLAMIDYCKAAETRKVLDPKASRSRVLGLDIDIRTHNRTSIEAHPLAHKIDMIQGSSIASETIAQVHEYAKGYEHILVCLDSNHTHEHVLAELEAYAPLVSPNSYCVVFDTLIEDTPDDMFPDRPWGKCNNPKTAVW
jgi:cephalosporin hydroxylase